MRYIFVRIPLLFLLVSLTAWSASGLEDSSSAQALLNNAFQRHVKNGLVDYGGMAFDNDFKEYLKWLGKVDPDSISGGQDVQMAFWINAYNALAIEGIIAASAMIAPTPAGQSSRALADELQRNRRETGNNRGYSFHPINSVLDVEGFFNKQKHKIAGSKYTLDHIEKKIIFPKYADPHLHFVLVCAAMSCPSLLSEIYTAENLSEKMEAVTRKFLINPNKNKLDRENKLLQLSQIFNWYLDDFGGSDAGVVSFISPYLDVHSRQFLRENKVKIRFLEYDWRLNRQP